MDPGEDSNMSDGHVDFDPERREEREIGREMVDKSTGLGSVAAHLYRGEMDRTVNWRGRLDQTTNWAVTVIGGILAYAFSGGGDISHPILIVAMLVGAVFLLIESKRFRDYDIWRSRVRVLQENLFANALDPSRGVEHRDWREQLSADYHDPQEKMSTPRSRTGCAGSTSRFCSDCCRSGSSGWRPTAATVHGSRRRPFRAFPDVLIGAVSLMYVVLIAITLWPSSEKTKDEDASEVDHGDLDRSD